ncbi:helix-turn-helix domain-containing protein [Streptomyces sp. NPDC058247]|uniref:helix-turn-helix domain-containing protein n=1 Tax=Streptomyces sp. NPDC058247 TaxID=3346401 RepID=UPI0036EE3ED5
MLQAWGLGPDEEAAYTALLARPTVSAQELVRQTGLETAETTRILLDLTTRGLVAVTTEAGSEVSDPADCVSGSRPARYRLTPPSVALAPMLVEQRNALHRAETAFSMLTEQYRRAPRGQRRGGGRRRGAVGAPVSPTQRGAQRELLVFLVGAPTAVPRDDADVSESYDLDRGVDFRVVAAKDYLDGPDMARDVKAGIAAGLEVRLADSLPLKMVVSDRSVPWCLSR